MAFKNLDQYLELATKAAAAAGTRADRESVVGDPPVTYTQFVGTLCKDMGGLLADIHHMATGIAGAGGDLLDASKKSWVYGKELDRTSMIEKLGDLEFYMQGLRLLLAISRQEILAANYEKLKARFGEAYSEESTVVKVDKLEIIDQEKRMDTFVMKALKDNPPVAPPQLPDWVTADLPPNTAVKAAIRLDTGNWIVMSEAGVFSKHAPKEKKSWA